MLEEIKNIKSEKSNLQNFGITFAVIFLVIAGFSLWKEKESFQIILAIGIILFLIAITIPVILKQVYWMWMVFATILGWFMTKLILSVLFYVVLTPIGALSRLFGKRFLELCADKLKDSYWNYRDTKKTQRVDYERQF